MMRVIAGTLAVIAGTLAACGPRGEHPAGGEVQAMPGNEAEAAADASPWLTADSAYPWSFPRDHGPHIGYKTEWWYFTGIVTAREAGGGLRNFGYQFTIFKVGVTPESTPATSRWAANSLLMGHAAVSDPSSGEHIFSEVLYRSSPLLAGFGQGADSVIAWTRAPPGTSAPWRLVRQDEGFTLEAGDRGAGMGIALTTKPTRPIVFQGPNGYSRKSRTPGRASMYYSHTRLATAGTIRYRGQEYTVTGTSWMDHEFSSNPLEPTQVGWDWLGLRFEDGRDLMAFRIRESGGEPNFTAATLTGARGRTRHLAPDEWSITPGRRWTSSRTGTRYPVEWTLTLPGEPRGLIVRGRSHSRENVSARLPKLYYWEGAVDIFRVSGERIGEGYLEMTGYGTGTRPAL